MSVNIPPKTFSARLYIHGRGYALFINQMGKVTLDINSFKGLSHRGRDY
jgi:hypothetical protein